MKDNGRNIPLWRHECTDTTRSIAESTINSSIAPCGTNPQAARIRESYGAQYCQDCTIAFELVCIKVAIDKKNKIEKNLLYANVSDFGKIE